MLSYEDACNFLSTVLEVKDVGNLLQSSTKYDFIETVMEAYREVEPFQNISLLALDLKDRRIPTWEDVKRAMFLKQGGLCYSHHWFLYELFKALNFDVAMLHSTVNDPNGHIIVLVKNVKKVGDLYLLEAGCGVPSFRLISLDFKEESPIFVDSYLEYKYIKLDGKIVRMHGDGDIKPVILRSNCFYIGKWRRFYDFELKETERIEDFDAGMEMIYTNAEESVFHGSFRFISYQSGKTRFIINKKFLIENENHELEMTEPHSDEEIIQYVNTLTSAFDEATLRKALKNYIQFKR